MPVFRFFVDDKEGSLLFQTEGTALPRDVLPNVFFIELFRSDVKVQGAKG